MSRERSGEFNPKILIEAMTPVPISLRSQIFRKLGTITTEITESLVQGLIRQDIDSQLNNTQVSAIPKEPSFVDADAHGRLTKGTQLHTGRSWQDDPEVYR